MRHECSTDSEVGERGEEDDEHKPYFAVNMLVHIISSSDNISIVVVLV